MFWMVTLRNVWKKIRSALASTLIGLFVHKNVPFSRLLCSDQEAYVKEGFGGNDIMTWPVYAFYQAYLNGQREAAHAAFCDWYLDQLRKYHATLKEKGGMLWGSLYRLIIQKYAEKRIDYRDDIFSDPVVVTQAIKERVDQRFAFLESIRQRGYDCKSADPIVGIKKKRYIYIVNGHHRWAALKLLGYDSLPEVRVFGQNISNLKKEIQRMIEKWKVIVGRK